MQMVSRAGFALALVVLAVAAGGCTSSKANVSMRCVEGRTIYAQSFSHAYIGSEHAGEYDVILTQDAPRPKPTGKNAPLQPMTGAELRQIVHIHVFWQADGGSVAKDGVVTNAAIDWYMIADEASDHPQVLRYEGAGVVTVDEGRKATSVVIRDGSMKKAEAGGGLKDPLGPSVLTGSIKAQHNPQLVRDMLADLKTRNLRGGGMAMSQIRQ